MAAPLSSLSRDFSSKPGLVRIKPGFGRPGASHPALRAGSAALVAMMFALQPPPLPRPEHRVIANDSADAQQHGQAKAEKKEWVDQNAAALNV
ncbi:hypothetical protein GVO57_07685 [Sphingomonas changnyeongensis]|uniref:Uncharacterized protein n=1 Tax=Sphingomonas changnyeongensis TaxID=2698679 RepID=A0A7Z2NWE2_9SPHN|nr:hypothetical protein [Sphingomonas changnyeongensis]QHL90737.1 hypothetical protein GVO57_07685 [Sphingomonas changnyeongensis]